MHFIFLTKTNWAEPPRIRHQLCNLLIEQNHTVDFYQKPNFLFRQKSCQVSRNLRLFRASYLIHHQLRLCRFLTKVNTLFEANVTKYISKGSEKSAVIVNFNYDYTFVRDLFPRNKIITIINDDFVSQAKFNHGKHVYKSLKRTCLVSDHVLAVSTNLVDKLSKVADPNLFLPWSIRPYRKPQNSENKRKYILIWGYIDDRIDINFLRHVATECSQYDFLIVGPIAKNFQAEIETLTSHVANICLGGTKSLPELPLDQILLALVPYKLCSSFGDSVTMLNKGFQLLAVGLPLLIRGMPNFLKSDCIFDVPDKNSFMYYLNYVYNNFEDLQDPIRNLVEDNSAAKRYLEFMDYVNS